MIKIRGNTEAPSPWLDIILFGYRIFSWKGKYRPESMPDYLEYDTVDSNGIIKVERRYIRPGVCKKQGLHVAPLEILDISEK